MRPTLATADAPRGSTDTAGYKHVCFCLPFPKDAFDEQQARRGADQQIGAETTEDPDTQIPSSKR